MGTARRNIDNLLVVTGAISAAWITFSELEVNTWPGHEIGLWRVLFTCGYFALGWRLRALLRKGAPMGEAAFLICAFLLTGAVIADVGISRFDAMPGPDLVDAYVLQGAIFSSQWWLRAVTNADYRRMCGWVVVIGAGLYRMLAWPYVAYIALA